MVLTIVTLILYLHACGEFTAQNSYCCFNVYTSNNLYCCYLNFQERRVGLQSVSDENLLGQRVHKKPKASLSEVPKISLNNVYLLFQLS